VDTAAEQLQTFLVRFEPAVAREAGELLARLHAPLPGTGRG
jgi:hypothetical protein